MSVEDVKRASRQLRGDLAGELVAPADSFESDSVTLLKFHGIYQQDDRDVRRPGRGEVSAFVLVHGADGGAGRAPPAAQWLAEDRLADLADGTMRLTTRQGMQFHFVPKGSLRSVVKGVNDARSRRWPHAAMSSATSWAARGRTSGRQVIAPLVDQLVARFRPRTRAYWELWIDGSGPSPRNRTRPPSRSRCTATSTCRASSRSPSPGRATTASTCWRTTSGSSRR